MKKLKVGKRRQPLPRKGRKRKQQPVRRHIGETLQSAPGPPPGSDPLNEAMLALQAGRPSAAHAHCQMVLATNPGDAEALNLAGVALFQLGEARQALSMLETAVTYHPDHVDALNNLGNVRKTLGWLTEAEAAYRRVLEVDPDYVDGHFNLGIVHELMGRFFEAEAAYRRCIAARPAFAEAHFNLANVIKGLGRLDEARQSYRRVLDFDAAFAAAHNNLATVEQEFGRLAEAEHGFAKAIELDPDFAEAHYNSGIILQERGRLEEAISAYRRTVEIEPGHAGAQVNIGYALKQLDRLDEAEAAYLRAMEIAPDYDKVVVNLGDLLLECGKPIAAVAACDDFLTDHPGSTSVLAFKAIALAEAGDNVGALVLLDFDRLLAPSIIDAPAGFADITAFNDALCDHVLAHPSLTEAPASHATRHGRHSGELLSGALGPMATFEEVVRTAVEIYRQARPADPVHPFLAQRPAGLGLSMWGVVMAAQGHQISHIHPAAWLSGVYYPRLPDAVREEDPNHAGWIEFGRPPEDFHCSAEPSLKLVRPEEGLMILFPSYFYHGTVPFRAENPRFSIAFDVLPLAEE